LKTIADIFEDFFIKLTKDCIPKVSDDCPENIFYSRNGYILMEYDSKTGLFWVSHTQIWLKLELCLALSEQETRDLLKGMLEKHYNLKDVTPNIPIQVQFFRLEKHYNLKDVTPVII
jgi:hypothetical protein